LDRYAKALDIKEASDDWYRFFDSAAADRGIVPQDIMSIYRPERRFWPLEILPAVKFKVPGGGLAGWFEYRCVKTQFRMGLAKMTGTDRLQDIRINADVA